MKNFIKNNFIGFILGIIVSTGVTYAATVSFNSGDVSHTKSNGTTTTVQAALNDLYTIHNGGDAENGDILSGKKAYSEGSLKTGSMSNYGTSTGLSCTKVNTSNTLYIKPSNSGYYTSSSSFNTGINYNPTGTGAAAATSGTSVTSSSTGVTLSGADLLLDSGSKISIPAGYYSSAINVSNVSSGDVANENWTQIINSTSKTNYTVTEKGTYMVVAFALGAARDLQPATPTLTIKLNKTAVGTASNSTRSKDRDGAIVTSRVIVTFISCDVNDVIAWTWSGSYVETGRVLVYKYT